jgi:hypothetical protein
MSEDIEITLKFMQQVREGEYAEIINIPQEFIRIETIEYPRVKEDKSLHLSFGKA